MAKKPRNDRAAGAPPAGPGSEAGGSARRLLVLGAAVAGLLAVVALWLWLSGGSRAFRGNTSAYNVLLVTLDTTRADHLGCYGRKEIRTPILDGLADTGVLFESAYTPAVMTLPSHASILTGLLPPAHGVRNNGSHRLLPATETLAEILRAAGWKTGAAVGAFVLDSMFGLDQGFESYDDYLPGSGSHDIFFAERRAGEVTDAALKFLSEAKAGRWFLWAHYFDPHSPHRPPPPFAETYASARYDGEIAYVDAELGRLLAGIREMGAGDRTIVIVAGDHGEGFRDHGEASHGVFLYDETARVPFLVTVPGFVEGPKRIASVVRTTDIVPTVLDLLRLPPRPGLDGRSLWPLLDGQTADLGLRAYGEAPVPLLMYGWSPLASLREGRWKYIEAPEPELYDMTADPGERTNLAAGEGTVASRLRDELRRIHTDAVESGRGSAEIFASPEEQEKLRSLGYVGGGGSPASKSLLASEPGILLEGGARGLVDPKRRVEALDRINRVYLAYGAGEFEGAIALARDLLAEDPGNDSVRQYMADSFRSLRRFDEALTEYRALLSRDPANVDVLLNAGWVLMNLERFEDAEKSFQRALAIHPGHTYALASLGNLRFVQGDYGQAVEYYRKVIQQRPNHRQSILAMAKIFERRGMNDYAKTFYARAAELDPKDLDSRLALGWLQFSSGENEKALETLNAAAALDPALPELSLARGDVYFALGRLQEAEAAYREGLRRAPDAAQGYHGLGLVAEQQGNAALARRLFQEALRVNPSYRASAEALRRLP